MVFSKYINIDKDVNDDNINHYDDDPYVDNDDNSEVSYDETH